MNAPDPLDLDVDTLRHPDSFKWTNYPPDVLPLWVADMDFPIAPSITKALRDRLDRPIGYHQVLGDPVLVSHLRAKLEAQGIVGLPEKGWVHFVTGVVPGLYACVLGTTQPGEEAITMTPIYPPFLSAITDFGRVAKHARLVEADARWSIDFDGLEQLVTPQTRLLMLCHPHNPTGRLWTRDELARLADFAERHDLFVVSDELHADLTLDGTFIPFTQIASPALRQRTLTITGPCKAYNTAGLGIGAIVAHSADLLKRVKDSVKGISGHPGAMSVTMWRAALQDDGQWLRAVLDALRDRRQLLADFVRDRLPHARLAFPEATYLAWLDYRAHPRVAELNKLILKQAKVALINGPAFGPGCEGFFRINFATSRAILTEALERLATLDQASEVPSPGPPGGG